MFDNEQSQLECGFGSRLPGIRLSMSHYVKETVGFDQRSHTDPNAASSTVTLPLRPLPILTSRSSPAPLLTRILLPNAAAPPSFEFVKRVTPGTPGLPVDTDATLADQQQLSIAEWRPPGFASRPRPRPSGWL